MYDLLSLSKLSLGIIFRQRSAALDWLFGRQTKNPENGDLAAKKEKNQIANREDTLLVSMEKKLHKGKLYRRVFVCRTQTGTGNTKESY